MISITQESLTHKSFPNTNSFDSSEVKHAFIHFRRALHEFTPRGVHFKFLLTPMRGWVGDKLAGLGTFLIQSGRFLMLRKFIDLNLVQIFEFWRHIFEFGRYIFEFWRHIFEF